MQFTSMERSVNTEAIAGYNDLQMTGIYEKYIENWFKMLTTF